MAAVTVRDVHKTLGGNAILRGVNLALKDGEFVVLVGPSGCGKSTLLRTLAGLEVPDKGEVRLDARDVTHAAPRDRDVAMVFQSYALYPHLTVRDNLAFGLRLRNTAESVITERIARVAKMLSIEGLLDRLPKDMSGGQRQRVAMGRAIAREPAVFLFDEPLSNLDAALRTQVRVEIKKVHQALKTTMIYVTHDQVEAMTLADRLVVLSAGTVEQEGPPLEVYRRPVSMFVASFLGSPAMNFVPARVSDDGAEIIAEGMRLKVDRARFGSALTAGREVVAGIRPHDTAVGETGGLTVSVDVVEPMGFEAYAHGHVGKAAFVVRLDGNAPLPSPGETLRVEVAPEAIHLFDPTTKKALGA